MSLVPLHLLIWSPSGIRWVMTDSAHHILSNSSDGHAWLESAAMFPKRTYPELRDAWPGAQLLIYNSSTSTDARPLCRVPLSFLQSCGVPDIRSVVRTIGEATVKEPVQLRDKDGNALADIDVFTIEFLFLHPVEPNATLTAIELPAGKSKYREVNLSASESTWSNSSHPSSGSYQVSTAWPSRLSVKRILTDFQSYLQAEFRTKVGVRDQVCLVTERAFESTTSAHLAPRSRPDVRQTSPIRDAADFRLKCCRFTSALVSVHSR